MNDILMHYGTPRHSGRYPWGSGENPYQRNKLFLDYVNKLKKDGFTEVDIAKHLGITTTELRAKKSLAKSNNKLEDISRVTDLHNKGYSLNEISRRSGLAKSTVEGLLKPIAEERAKMSLNIANALKEELKNKEYLDVGVGVESHLGVSRTKLSNALSILKEEGYNVHEIYVDQLGTGKKTTILTLTKPGVTQGEVFKNKDKIGMINGHYSEDGGRTLLNIEPPKSISSKRLLINYAETGGATKDGVIELRRGVDDISLGNSKYAQVRIAVDGTHYLKGMALYSDDLPKGIDIRFNTNKSSKNSLQETLKPIKDDPDNPFGATIRQRHYIDKNGKKQLSALNIVNEEGDWNKWSKTISSQVLSKQSPELAKKQLGISLKQRKEEYKDIMSLTNPVIRKKLLKEFSDECDSAAVHLKAAALPRQSNKVILPFNSLKENEVYAPSYRNGEKVALIRHPHGGIFEIPELRVNNKNKEANKTIKNAIDAIGINHKVAERLSGADFDGDSVLVIPNNRKEIKTSKPIKGLIDFDPKENYKLPKEAPVLKEKARNKLMGQVSNLITDMTIKGANTDELSRAVKHSMVVIDASKHHLNYKQSAIDNGIVSLKEKYQGGPRKGASTLISRSSSEERVGRRKEYINKETGEREYKYTGESYSINGKKGLKTISSTKMFETKDARKLSSGTKIENVYADYANSMKSLANEARKEMIRTPRLKYSPSAKKVYSSEVDSLNSKLNVAMKSKPYERQAQLFGNEIVRSKKQANPNLEASEIKKIKGQALAEARSRVGEKKVRIDISSKEWEAIQAGAISNNKLELILANSDSDKIKKLATPKKSNEVSQSIKSRVNAMLDNGYTMSEVADTLGLSTSTITKINKE